MNQAIRNAIKYAFLSGPIQSVYQFVEPYYQRRLLRRWERSGRALPPPSLAKQRIVREYAAAFSMRVFIETGTYLGSMVEATRDIFDQVISIELDRSLYQRAKKRFSPYDHISILHGSSADVLPRVLASLDQPCLFWLDAHYSGQLTAKGAPESPIAQEISCILAHPIEEHVVLIDDARAFGQNGYPSMRRLQEMVAARRPRWAFIVQDDIIRLHAMAPNATSQGDCPFQVRY